MMVMLVGSVRGVDDHQDSLDPFGRWCVFSSMGFSSLLTGFRAVTLTRAIPWRYSLDLETDILAAIIPCSTPDGFLLLYLLGGSTGDPEQTLQFWEVLETIRGCRTDADHWFLLGWVPHIRGLNWGAWRNSLDTRDSLVSMDWILWWNYTLLTLWCVMNRWRLSALLHPCSITSLSVNSAHSRSLIALLYNFALIPLMHAFDIHFECPQGR